MDSSGNAAAASDPQSQGTTGGTQADAAAPHNVADLTAFVQTLLQQMVSLNVPKHASRPCPRQSSRGISALPPLIAPFLLPLLYSTFCFLPILPPTSLSCPPFTLHAMLCASLSFTIGRVCLLISLFFFTSLLPCLMFILNSLSPLSLAPLLFPVSHSPSQCPLSSLPVLLIHLPYPQPLDEMGTRIDELERNVSDLIKETGGTDPTAAASAPAKSEQHEP
ncbi:unnamed protein product [Closterium sp. NIES-53]